MSPRIHQHAVPRSSSSTSSSYSDSSYRTRSTAPTVHTAPVVHGLRHTSKHLPDKVTPWLGGDFEDEPIEEVENTDEDLDERTSALLYESSVASIDDLPEEPQYQVAEPDHEIHASSAIPTLPAEFSELFPSTRRLLIRHDDATTDGNMNLRVDTEVLAGGRRRDMTLYHLRMHDLKDREFSLRRYCRESGREVCHTTRKYVKPAVEKRPGLQRSMSSAFATLRPKSESKTATRATLKRFDSGYDSLGEEDEYDFDEYERPSTSSSSKPASMQLPTNTTKLEFSNYAHVDVKRRGTKASKRYEFEYWGSRYQWRREAKKDRQQAEISYHLVNVTENKEVAHIVPDLMSDAEARQEEAMGGWIPPSSMWISDEKLASRSSDVAEFVHLSNNIYAFKPEKIIG